MSRQIESSSEDWFLIFSEDDNSHSVIGLKFVINVKSVKTGDTVTFFCRNKPYVGKIVNSGTRDEMERELKLLGTAAKRVYPTKQGNDTPTQSLAKRPTKAPSLFGNPIGSGSGTKSQTVKPSVQVKQDKRTRDRILALNKANAVKYSNKQVITAIPVKNSIVKDHDYDPDQDNQSEVSSASDISALAANSIQRKKVRETLVRGIKKIDVPSTPISTSTPIKSPTKEEYKKMIADLNFKLQVIYDKETVKDSSNPDFAEKKVKDWLEKSSEHSEFGITELNSGVQEELLSPRKRPNETESPEETQGSSKKSKNSEEAQFPSFESVSSRSEQKCQKAKLSDNKADITKEEEEENSKDIKVCLDLDEDYKDQLYGPGQNMVNLGKDIFCEKKVLSEAMKKSSQPSHMARRLIKGVFKEEACVNCTLTGQAWRAGENNHERDPLHPKAVDVIIEYSKKWGVMKKLPSQRTRQIRQSMTNGLGEIRRHLTGQTGKKKTKKTEENKS